MDDLQYDNFESGSSISLWTFDCLQSLTALPPFCDTANTISIPGESFSEWFGNIEVPEIKYKVLIGNINKFSHCGLLVKANIICIIEKFLATRARCVTVFKTNMERMRYKTSGATREDALNEIKEFADTMEKLSSVCQNQINSLIFHNSHRKSSPKNFLNQFTNMENDDIMKVILSVQINKKIPDESKISLALKLNRELKIVKTLLKDRRLQIKKFGQGLIQRPSWIPPYISDESLINFSKGGIFQIPPETQPEIDFVLHSL